MMHTKSGPLKGDDTLSKAKTDLGPVHQSRKLCFKDRKGNYSYYYTFSINIFT